MLCLALCSNLMLCIKRFHFSVAVTNGFASTEKKGSGVQNSTPTLKSQHDFTGRVDDMGGLISPLREEVFENSSQDQNATAYPQDPSSLGTTFSSVGTIGSYCDGG